MKKIITKQKERVVQPIQYIEKEVEHIYYEAEDGKKFEDKKSCVAYEKQLHFFKKTKKLDLYKYEFLPENGELYYLETEEDWETLKTYKGTTLREYSSSNIRNPSRDLTFPQWVLFENFSGGDYSDTHYYFFEDEIKIKIEHTLLIKDYMESIGETHGNRNKKDN